MIAKFGASLKWRTQDKYLSHLTLIQPYSLSFVANQNTSTTFPNACIDWELLE